MTAQTQFSTGLTSGIVQVHVEMPDGSSIHFRDDSYSDRIRCDHPVDGDGELLASVLRTEAEARGRGRIVVLCPREAALGLEAAGFSLEAVMHSFYQGQRDCFVLGDFPDGRRARAQSGGIEGFTPSTKEKPRVETRRATKKDAKGIAALIGSGFDYYPTPSDRPDYIASLIEKGIPFRIIDADGDIVACASADLVDTARAAEITDCVTRPDQRGKGLMQWLILDLLCDLDAIDYPTAFTLARASEIGMNKAFYNTGFRYRGTMSKSCRIGTGIEDINVWSRDTATAYFPK